MKKNDGSKMNVPVILLAVFVLGFAVCQYIIGFDIVGMFLSFLAKLGIARPSIEGNGAYGLILLFGLITSVHCIGMCGGIIMSVSMSEEKSAKGSRIVSYHTGRLFSYIMIGLFLGGIGQSLSGIASIGNIVPIISGIVIIVIAVCWLLNGYGVKFPKSLGNVFSSFQSKSPLALGLLMGFLPCGTLQTMYIYCLGLENALEGMLSMALFAIGTLPGLLGFSLVTKYALSGNLKWLHAVSGIIMLAMGIEMLGSHIV